MTFREALLKIGEVRSLLPQNVNVMALTATATHTLRMELAHVIGMKSPVMVVLPPCKPNIMYKVREYTSIEHDFMPVVEQLGWDILELLSTVDEWKIAQIYTYFFSIC